MSILILLYLGNVKMICSKCKEDVAVLNDTEEGEMCYNCRNKKELKIKPFPIRTPRKKRTRK